MARSDRLLTLTQALRRRDGRHGGRSGHGDAGFGADHLPRHCQPAGHRRADPGRSWHRLCPRTGYDLPPLMLTPEEAEALMLGARFVRERGDPDLQRIIDDAIAKIEAVLPESTSALLARGAALIRRVRRIFRSTAFPRRNCAERCATIGRCEFSIVTSASAIASG